MASHKFSEHLLKLSENKEDIEEAKKEWKFVCEQKLEEQTGICICQRKIKNVTSLFNTCTKETISVGTRCYTKFDFKAANLGQSMKKLIDMIREKGEYTFINDFNQYVLDNEELVIANFQTEYAIHINSITELSILKENVYNLIMDDGVLYLKDTFTAIDTRIKYLQEKERQYALKRQEKERQDRQKLQEEKRKQEEKKKQEDQIKQVTKDYDKHYYNIQSLEQLNIAIEECKENIHLKEIQTTIQTRIHALQETERQEREEQRKREILREQQERESKQRTEDLKCQEEKIREQERQYYIQCACGLSYGQICKCKSPKYILSPSSDGQQYSCKTCKNWKDRCKK